MAFILDKASQGFGKRFAIHALPNIDTATEKDYERVIRATGHITKGSIIEFDVPNNSPDYINPASIKLLLKINILKDDGSPVTEDENVSFINFPAATIIRQVDFTLQQQQISPGVGPNYPYKAYIDVITRLGKSAQVTYLKAAMFEKDLAGAMDSHTPKNTLNVGLAERFKRTKSGKYIIFEQKLFLDFSECKKELINGVGMNVKVYPATDKFALMFATPGNYSFNIVDAALAVKFIKVNPGLLLLHNKKMKDEPAIFTYPRSEIRAYNIPTQSYDAAMDNIFQDAIPEELFVMFVDSDSYNGHNEKNPLNFAHNDITYIDFKVDGFSNEANIITPDFTDDNYACAYNRLFDSCDLNNPPNITYDDFKGGYCIFKFNLRENGTRHESALVRKGQTRVTVKFKNPLPRPVTALFYGKFLGVTTIDNARNVIVVS